VLVEGDAVDDVLAWEVLDELVTVVAAFVVVALKVVEAPEVVEA